MSFTAIVACTKCGKKFSHTSEKYGEGDLVTVRCPDGHLSKDVLYKATTMENNSTAVVEEAILSQLDEPNLDDDDDDRGEPELAAV